MNQENGNGGPSHLNQGNKVDTPYLTTDQTTKELKISEIKQFKSDFHFIDDTEAFLPVVINTPEGNFCIDGYDKIEQAKEAGKTGVKCEVFSIAEHSEVELMLRKLAGRSKPTAGRARYPELILGVKQATKLLEAEGIDIKTFKHGGARKGESFNDEQENNINVILSERLGKSADTVRKLYKFSRYVDDTTLETLAKKDKELDGKGTDAKRPSKSFFENIQSSKNDFIDRLETPEDGKELTGEEKEKEVSKKVLEAFDQYSDGKPITAFSGKKVSKKAVPVETDINKTFITFSSSIDDCKKATVTGKDKIVKILEGAEGLIKVARESAKKNKIIKIPKGPAREYSQLSLNYYTTCDHGCVYCYNARWEKKNSPTGSSSTPPPKPAARKDVLELIRKDAERMKFLGTNDKQVLFSFWGDPYCCEESNLNLTTEVLKILLENEIPTAILTKGGTRCLKDLELFKQFGEGIKVGLSLTFTDDNHSRHFEPNAALPQDRFDALKTLHDAGIKTWASEEPVIDVDQSLEIIDITKDYVDEVKLGKLSGSKIATLVNKKFPFNTNPDYKHFLHEAVKMLRSYKKDFYVKEALRKCDPSFKLEDHEIDMDHLTLKKFK